MMTFRFTMRGLLLVAVAWSAGCSVSFHSTDLGAPSSRSGSAASASPPAASPAATAPGSPQAVANRPPPPTPAEVLKAFDAALSTGSGSKKPDLTFAGFYLGMTPEEALAVCNEHGGSHTRVLAAVDSTGQLLGTMPMADSVHSSREPLEHFPELKPPAYAGPYQATLNCIWAAGHAVLSYSPPPSNAVSSIEFSSMGLPIGLSDLQERMVSRYGAPADQVGPRAIQLLRPSDSQVVTNMKWLALSPGNDCAPRVRKRSPVSTATVFTPSIPLGSSKTASCRPHLLARASSNDGRSSIMALSLESFSSRVDQTDRFWAELRAAHPKLPPQPSLRGLSTESPQLACKALNFLGCEQSSAAQCMGELEFINRVRHVMSSKDAPTDRSMYQCLIASTSVEEVRACGVPCEESPGARHASVGPAFPGEFFAATCEQMRRLKCGVDDLGQCDLALQGWNNGYMSADCVESAQSQLDVLYCGGACRSGSAEEALLATDFTSSCSNLKKLKCEVGQLDVCEEYLRVKLPELRDAWPAPHECLTRAKNLHEVAMCGLGCKLPPAAGRGTPGASASGAQPDPTANWANEDQDRRSNCLARCDSIVQNCWIGSGDNAQQEYQNCLNSHQQNVSSCRSSCY